MYMYVYHTLCIFQLAVEAPKRSTLATAFSDRSFQGQMKMDARTVAGFSTFFLYFLHIHVFNLGFMHV